MTRAKLSRSEVEAIRSSANLARIVERSGVALTRDGSRFKGCCPFHGERSPSFYVFADHFHCFGCGAHGDVFSFLQLREGLSFAEAIERLGAGTLAPSQPTERNEARERAPATKPRTYPPRAELAALWRRTVPIDQDSEAARYLEARGVDVTRAVAEDIARVATKGTPLPRWAVSKAGTWHTSNHRLLFLLRDHEGRERSILARRIGSAPKSESDAPKTLPPAGYRTSALALLCRASVRVLRGAPKEAPPWGGIDPLPHLRRVIVAEGEIKFLIHASRVSDACDDTAVLGVRSGSWKARSKFAATVPDGAHVFIATDPDSAGARYATNVLRSLEERWRAGRVAIELRPGHALALAADKRIAVVAAQSEGARDVG